MHLERYSLTPYLVQFIFYFCTVAWFTECLPKIATNTQMTNGMKPDENALTATSYSICFLIGYKLEQIKNTKGRAVAITTFLLTLSTWFNFNLPTLIPDDLEKYNTITYNKLYNYILSSTHILTFSLGLLTNKLLVDNNRHLSQTAEYLSMTGVIYLANTKLHKHLWWTCVIVPIVCLINAQYCIYNHLQLHILESSKVTKCPYFNNHAVALYQMYPVVASVVYVATVACCLFNNVSEINTQYITFVALNVMRLSRQLDSQEIQVSMKHISIDQGLSLIGLLILRCSMTLGYFYYVICYPVCSQMLRNPTEIMRGLNAIYDLSKLDITSSSKFRDAIISMVHKHGTFRIPLIDASFVATTNIPEELSKQSKNSTTSPFIKSIQDIAGDTLFTRNVDKTWVEMKRELRKCLTKPTFMDVDASTDQLEQKYLLPCYKCGDTFELMCRIVTRIMLVDVTGIEISRDVYEEVYDTLLNDEREVLVKKVMNMENVDPTHVYKTFDGLRKIIVKSNDIDLNGWLVKSLMLKIDKKIESKEDILNLMDMWRKEDNLVMIKRCNEIGLSMSLAVPTTASLGSRCMHVINYIRERDNVRYEELMNDAIQFYNDNRDKPNTLKKPIINNGWVDFVVNVMYWYPPTVTAIKLIKHCMGEYESGDVVMIALNCDPNSPPHEKMYERYEYMLKNPKKTVGEALWKDDRICAGAYFAQNEAAFILGKIYDKFEVKTSNGNEVDYITKRISFNVELTPKQ